WGADADYNVQVDVPSAYTVLQQANPTLIPLSVTVETALRRAYLPTLRHSGPLAQLLARQAEAFAQENRYEAQFGQTCSGLPDDSINFLHDPLACAIALGWCEGVEIREIPLRLEIVHGWLYQRVDADGKPTRIVTHVDGRRFSDFWFNTLSRITPHVSHF
ncbi:MAG: nucleoside hydrolase, partial [Chloroflexota bacterium]